MADVVQVEVDSGLATVSLNRPDKLNAVSNDVFQGLYDAGQQVAEDDSVRAVLLRGEGRAFCSGLDLSSLSGFASSDGSGGGGGAGFGFEVAQGGFTCWHSMDKPVVAAVQGYALGAGFQLALAADIRIVAEDVTLSAFEVTYGLVPDLGGTYLLPAVVGPARAKELTWTARKFGAAEAEAWGFANAVASVDDVQHVARAMAEDLASRPPISVQRSKRLLNEAPHVSLAQGLADVAEAQIECLRSNDMKEAISAAFEKREATYTGT